MTPRAAPVTLNTTGTPDTPGKQGVNILDHALEEPYWLEDLDLARRHLAREWAPSGCLIEANPITVGGVRSIAQLWKHPVPDQEHGLVYGVSVFLAKTAHSESMAKPALLYNFFYSVAWIGSTSRISYCTGN
jgi:hypothetical protein